MEEAAGSNLFSAMDILVGLESTMWVLAFPFLRQHTLWWVEMATRLVSTLDQMSFETKNGR